MKRNIFAWLVIAAFAVQAALGQASVPAVKITKDQISTAQGVTAKQLSDYLYFVASDEMEGRDTPSRGLDTIAKFIGMNLSRWGFKPAGDNGTYFQKIALHRDTIDPAATSVSFNGQPYVYAQDLIRVSENKLPAAPIVFVGNGWYIRSKNLDPYAGLDIKGKIVAVLSEGMLNSRTPVPMPSGTAVADLTGTRGTEWADPVTYARSHGAAGVIILPSKYVVDNWNVLAQQFARSRLVVDKLQTPSGAGAAVTPLPVAFVSPKLASAIFTGESGDPLAGYTQAVTVAPAKTLTYTISVKPETLTTQNVVAIWEGSDPKMKDEMVAIGAHYDHIGISVNPNLPDRINNGADDDGSGTVSVLSIAEALAKAPRRPKRSILFVWHCGEEKGLWGSEYFNKYPTVDVKKVIAQLNIDMIGRSKAADDTEPRDKDLSGPNSVYVIGKDMMSSTLGNMVSGVNNGYLKIDYDTRYDDPKDPNRFFFRSDHFNYALNGIPITFWFDGVSKDYHQPSDEPTTIDYNKMEKVARTIMITLLQLADMKERPKIDKQLPPELTQR